MKYTFPIALRIASGRSQNGTGRLLWFSIAGIVVSSLVILISLSVILGFKRQVASVSYSQTGNISLYPYGESWTSTAQYIQATPALLNFIANLPDVERVSPIVQGMALLKTEDNFLGIGLYGVEGDRYAQFFSDHLYQGTLPDFSLPATEGNPIVLPSATAERMSLKVGDKVHLYFLESKIKLRAFTIVGTYQSAGLTELPALCSATILRKIKGIAPEDYSRIAITTKTEADVDAVAHALVHQLSQQDIQSIEGYGLSTAKELLSDVFAWLSMLDSNVIFLSIVMLTIGAFTMISGVIIIVLDKTAQIGILKALGAGNRHIRHIFTYIALRLVVYGLVLGNLLAFLLLWIQRHFQVIRLNPEDYYMDSVPVVFDWGLWLLVDVGILALLSAIVMFSTRIITQISPAQTVRFE